ncbi:MAG: type 1 glutamine amidotransferase [Phycisphaerales bacterium]
MSIIVLQHWNLGKPGRLGLTLRDHGFRLDIRRLDAGDPVPTDYDNVDAVVSLGGPQNVGDNVPWMQPEMDYIKGAHARAIPVIGVCLGHQLIAAALGGTVAKMPAPEIGMGEVNITPAGHTDPILAGIAWSSRQFQSHGCEVTQTPPDSAVLASSPACKVQAMRVGMRTYGFQYHFELDRESANEYMAQEGPEACAAAGVTMDAYRQSMDKHYEMFSRLADRLSVNLATLLIPRVASKVG